MKRQLELKSFPWVVYIDGAARNNPGPAGVGIYIQHNKHIIEKKGFFIGIKTNNQAEYFALLVALYYLRWHAVSGAKVLIKSDSELLVRQIEGIYKIKNAGLKPLYILAKSWLELFDYTLFHVMREENSMADMLANIAIDQKKDLPEVIADQFKQHDIAV